MILIELLEEYLQLIEIMGETPGMYLLDNKRRAIHNEILIKLHCDEEKLKCIMTHLDIACGFEQFDKNHSIKMCARDLERLLECREGQNFIKIHNATLLRTRYGVIEFQ